MLGSINTSKRLAHMLGILMSMEAERDGRGGNMDLQSVSDQCSQTYCEETEFVFGKCIWIKSVL